VMHETQATLVSHDYLARDAEGAEWIVACAERFRAAANPYLALYRKGIIATSTVLADTAKIRVVGGMDPSLRTAQDFDLWLKLLAPENASFHIFAGAHMIYAAGEGGITGNTERRLHCTRIIAKRYLSTVRAKGGGFVDFSFRTAAVHMEAMVAYRRRNRPGMALWTAIRGAARLLTAPFVYAADD
jgi:hypothetical protein